VGPSGQVDAGVDQVVDGAKAHIVVERIVPVGEVRVTPTVVMSRVVMMPRVAVIVHTGSTTPALVTPSLVTPASVVSAREVRVVAASSSASSASAPAAAAPTVPDAALAPGLDDLGQATQAQGDRGHDRHSQESFDPSRRAAHGCTSTELGSSS
jgi:hypothetical protein